jgi:DNA-binding CsgD family transcriptional regulator
MCPTRQLTNRETEAVAHKRQGLSQGAIADIMGVTHQRVSDLLLSAWHKTEHGERVDPNCSRCLSL